MQPDSVLPEFGQQLKEGTVGALHADFQQLNIRRPYRDAQDKPAWQDRTCATHT